MVSDVKPKQLPDTVLDADISLVNGGKIGQPDTSFDSNVIFEPEQKYFKVGKIRDSKASITSLRFGEQTKRIETAKDALTKNDTASESIKREPKPIFGQRDFNPVPETKSKLSCRKMAELFEETNRFLAIDGNLNIYDRKRGLFIPLNNECADALIRRQSPDEIKDHLTRYSVQELVLWLKSKTYWEEFDGEKLKNLNANCINFQNCTVEFPTLTVHNHSPDFFCTNVLGVPYSNAYIDYKRSLFFKVVTDLLGDSQKKIYLLQEMYGVVIVGILLKHFYYLYGLPDSGKSKIAEVLRYIVGAEFVSAITLKKFDSQFGLGGLYRKRLNIAGESHEITSGGVEIIKRITGGDYTRGERKYEHGFDFHPQAALVFMSNHKLQVIDGKADQALLNRMVVLEFSRSIPLEKQDAKLSSRLKEPQEIAAAISWALEGARRVYDNDCKLSYYPNAEEYVNYSPSTSRNRQMELANHFKEYLTETFDIDPENKEDYTKVTDIFTGFMEYIGATEEFEYKDNLCLHNILQDEFHLEKKRIKPTGQKHQVYAYIGLRAKQIQI